MKKNTFTLLDENGNEKEYEVLFTYECDQTEKNYIAYTDNSKDENGDTVVYASIYHPEDSTGRLEAIEDEREWKIIEAVLETLQEEIKNSNKENNEQ